MRGCDTCKWKNTLGAVAEGAETEQRRASAKVIVSGLEENTPNCAGWSTARYVGKLLSPDPPVDIMKKTTGIGERLMPAVEEACVNPYRATDEYWEQRADLIDAGLVEMGVDPSDWPTSRTMPEMAAHVSLIKDHLRNN